MKKAVMNSGVMSATGLSLQQQDTDLMFVQMATNKI
jgi:hypothetical protein